MIFYKKFKKINIKKFDSFKLWVKDNFLPINCFFLYFEYQPCLFLLQNLFHFKYTRIKTLLRYHANQPGNEFLNINQFRHYFQFQYPVMFPHPSGPLCQNEFLCYSAYIGHTITQIPFIFINHNFNLITEDTVVLQFDDFDEPHYVYWRNIQNPDYTFLNLFYGPIFSSLSVATFYLVSRTFNYTQKTSIALTLIFGFSTPIWAYSQTSLNSVPIIFLILLSFFYFRKY